ncbi:uncharacterized protein LOC117652572 isoform X2 [Thrips palmi]|nr:uncharacterized protein LOC117652572 isoform X2 [Thrips palmi]
MTELMKGRNHMKNYEPLLATDSKSTCSTASDGILGSGQKSGEQLRSKGAFSEAATEDKVELKYSTPACSVYLSDVSEDKIGQLSIIRNSSDYNAVDETCCSDWDNSCKEIETALRKSSALELPDLNNVANDGLEESIPRSRGAISAVPEDPLTNWLLTPTKQSVEIGSMDYCLVCCVPIPMNSMSLHSKGKKHLKNYEALLAADWKRTYPTSSSVILSSGQKNSSEAPLRSLNKSSETFTKTEVLALQDTVNIGDSTLSCLQEEFEKIKISVEQDLNDYELECGTCGGVFQTYNNDVDLSLDLHVQNDPQHALATAMPLDRDAKQMAELVKNLVPRILAPKKRPRKSVGSKILEGSGNGSKCCLICLQDISSLSSQAKTKHLENCVNPNSLTFFCKVCSESMTQAHKGMHLESKGHKAKASLNFFCSICSENMTAGEKENHLISERHREMVASDFFCEICDKTVLDKKMHNLKSHKFMASSRFFCYLCSENMDEWEKENHLMSERHRQKAALYFFCEICKRWMVKANEETHIKGKLHKSMLSRLSQDFFCTFCSVIMAEKDKEYHLIGAKHRQKAGMTLYCEICKKWMMEANKTTHLEGREHKRKMGTP